MKNHGASTMFASGDQVGLIDDKGYHVCTFVRVGENNPHLALIRYPTRIERWTLTYWLIKESF